MKTNNLCPDERLCRETSEVQFQLAWTCLQEIAKKSTFSNPLELKCSAKSMISIEQCLVGMSCGLY